MFNVKEFIYKAPRTDIISANKEGIFGMVGFIAIYLIGLSLGANLKNTKNLFDVLKILGRMTFKCFIIYIIAVKSFGPVSRRLVIFIFSVTFFFQIQ